MLNDFTDFVGAGFSEAAEVFGFTSAMLLGKKLEGILDMMKLDRSLALDGEKATTPGTFMVSQDQLVKQGFATPWERTLEGKKLVIGPQSYRVISVAIDESNVTFTLDDSNR